MGRWDDIKKLKDAASDSARVKVEDADVSKLAGDAVLGVSAVLDGAESVARRSGMTSKAGDISKLKVARAAVRPRKSARRVFDATAEEVRARREIPGEAVPPEPG